MSDNHPSLGDLEHYVIGALEVDAALVLENHVASCAMCAAALAQEARLEVALHQIARAPTPLHAAARRSRTTLAVAGAMAVLACAAALLVVLGRSEDEMVDRRGDSQPAARHEVSVPRHETTPTYDATVSCLEPDGYDRCVREAHRRGLVVTRPTINVPRYEYVAAEQLR